MWLGSWQRFLRASCDGDLLDAITTLETKIMIYEDQSRETISDSLKMCVIAGMGPNSMNEHLLMVATKCDSWTNSVERLNQLSTREKPSLHRHRWRFLHFKETATSAGNTDTLRKNVGVRAMERQRSLNVRNVERNIMDSVGHGATHHPIKTHRKEDGKVTEKETARERKVESSKEEKAEINGKEKEKERKDNVSTKSQIHQKNSGQVDLGNKEQNNLGMLKQTLRIDGTMIGTQQVRILKPQRQLRNFNMRLSVICDSRIWVVSNTLNLFSMTDWILHSELSHLVFLPLQNCCSCQSPCSTRIFGPQRFPSWMCVQHCRPRQSV